MNTHLFNLLQQRVHSDCAIPARLFELTDPNDFFLAVRTLAEELGYRLEESDMLEARQAGRRAWSNRNKQ